MVVSVPARSPSSLPFESLSASDRILTLEAQGQDSKKTEQINVAMASEIAECIALIKSRAGWIASHLRT